MAHGYDLAVGPGHKLARNYGNRHSSPEGPYEDEKIFKKKFKHMFRLTTAASKFKKMNKEALHDQVKLNLESLRPFTERVDTTSTGMHTRRDVLSSADFQVRDHLEHYRVLPTTGTYVTFSDIHLTNHDNRQNFFERANKELYLDILAHYYGPREFTLIENGDIEELLVYEPNIEGLPAADDGTQPMPDFKKIRWDDDESWRETIDDRVTRKWAYFNKIVHEHADYYRTINEHFIARGAYYRTIGNHDTNMADRSYAEFIKETHGISWPTASDIVVLAADETIVTHIICHGHQFDAVSTKRYAEKAGESLSEGGAWAYEGPDRQWTLEMDDELFLTPWLAGDDFFNNTLSTSEPASDDQNLAGILSLADDFPLGQGGWEAVFLSNIAWEYFEHRNADDAYHLEAEAGIRWFKMRHMSEVDIVTSMIDQFAAPNGSQANIPTLVLGHSHEPRLNAGDPTNGNVPIGFYLNSAAAGRFENLIWAIELHDGEPIMISWHRDYDSWQMVRTVWEDQTSNGIQNLRAVSRLAFNLPQSNAGYDSTVQTAINNILLP